MAGFSLIPKFYDDDELEFKYQSKIRQYRQALSTTYPNTFNWEFDAQQIIELCRLEIELDIYDEQIGNGMINNINSKERKRVRDSIPKYRSDLGITIKIRLKRATVAHPDDDMNSLLNQFGGDVDDITV